MDYNVLQHLSNDNLLDKMHICLSDEFNIVYNSLFIINEIEKRLIVYKLGYSSMFNYLVKNYHFTHGSAARRVNAARLIQKYPQAAELLEKRQISLSTLNLIKPSVTPETIEWLLENIKGKSFQEAEDWYSIYHPIVKHRDKMKNISCIVHNSAQSTENPDTPSNPACNENNQNNDSTPEQTALFNNDELKLHGNLGLLDDSNGFNQSDVGHNSTDSLSSKPTTIIQEMVEIKFIACPEFAQKVEKMKSLLSHQMPNGITLEDLFDKAMQVYLDKFDPEARDKRRQERIERTEKKETSSKKAQVSNSKGIKTYDSEQTPNDQKMKNNKEQLPFGDLPMNKSSQQTTIQSTAQAATISSELSKRQPIPQSVRDFVWKRDQSQCSMVHPNGVRCKSKHQLEIDHIKPICHGGDNQVNNLRLVCRSCNILEANKIIGKNIMSKYQSNHPKKRA